MEFNLMCGSTHLIDFTESDNIRDVTLDLIDFIRSSENEYKVVNTETGNFLSFKTDSHLIFTTSIENIIGQFVTSSKSKGLIEVKVFNGISQDELLHISQELNDGDVVWNTLVQLDDYIKREIVQFHYFVIHVTLYYPSGRISQFVLSDEYNWDELTWQAIKNVAYSIAYYNDIIPSGDDKLFLTSYMAPQVIHKQTICDDVMRIERKLNSLVSVIEKPELFLVLKSRDGKVDDFSAGFCDFKHYKDFKIFEAAVDYISKDDIDKEVDKGKLIIFKK